jgi:hypothetical protein
MRPTTALLLFYLAACRRPGPGPATPEEPAPRAVARIVPPEEAWQRHTIHAGPNGADGVHLADIDGDGDQDAVTPWEQSGIVTVSLNPGCNAARGEWPTTIVGSSMGSVEDARFADIDDDGRLDIVAAGETRKVWVLFGPVPPATVWTKVTIGAATNVSKWIKADVADLNGDGKLDILVGGKVEPAQVGWLTSPTPRVSTSWTYNQIGPASWVMSLFARDLDGDGDQDVLVTDRGFLTLPDGTRDYSRAGVRWIERTGATWIEHPIGRDPGEAKMCSWADVTGDGREDVAFASSNENTGSLALWSHDGTCANWTRTEVPMPANVGQVQDVQVGDIDRDGDMDLVVSSAHADPPLSGIVWLEAPTWTRHEVSGPDGIKFDHAALADVDGDGDADIVQTEQHWDQDGDGDQGPGLGLVWFRNEAAD